MRSPDAQTGDGDPFALHDALAKVLREIKKPSSDGYAKILTVILEHTPWEAAGLWLPGDVPSELTCAAFETKSKWSPGGVTDWKPSHPASSASGRDLPEKAWKTGKPLWGGPLPPSTGSSGECAEGFGEIQTRLAHPLQLGKKHLGVLELYSRKEMAEREALSAFLFSPCLQFSHFLDGLNRSKSETEGSGAASPTFQTFADSASMFIWTAGIEGDRDFFNRPWLLFRGRTLEQELGNGWKQGVHPQDRKRYWETYLSAVEKRLSFRVEFRLKRHDGVFRSFRDEGSPIFDERGRFSGYVGHVTDTTELKVVEDQLRQSQKLETIGRLAGGIAHDFNNLLTAINGFGKLALAVAPQDKGLREYLQEIVQAGEAATTLTQQLLNYSRKTALNPVVTNLNLILLEMKPLFKSVIQDEIDLAIHLEPNLGHAQIDVTQLKQLILNLVLNAKDAMPHGGHLTIETSNIFIEEMNDSFYLKSQHGQHVLLEVKDTGEGMNKDVLARIFDPFFTTKPMGKGTGLGLMNVKGIVKDNSGSIDVYSEPGKGTIFKIFLPFKEVEIPAGSAGEAPSAPEEDLRLRGNETILVVEDDPVVAKFVHQLLEENGYTVFNAGDAAEALLALKISEPIDLVLTDLVMPGLSGQQLADEVLSRRPDMNFLFMSGYSESWDPYSEAYDKRKIDLIKKPFDERQLLTAVKGALEKKAKTNPRPG